VTEFGKTQGIALTSSERERPPGTIGAMFDSWDNPEMGFVVGLSTSSFKANYRLCIFGTPQQQKILIQFCLA
jgi:hypothetical protein